MSEDKKVIFSMTGVTKTYTNANQPVLKNIYLSFFYGAKIGILGLNVTANLSRPGQRIKLRSKHKAKVGKTHKITPIEAKDYLTVILVLVQFTKN